MLQLRHFILFISLLFLLGHSVVGHSHDDFGSHIQVESKQSQESIIDWLKELFHADLGNHHLEEMELSEMSNESFDGSNLIILICQCRLSISVVNPIVYYSDLKICDSLIFPSNHFKRIYALRGSPLYS